MNLQRTAIGLDVGAVFVKMVVLDEQGCAIASVARRHHGNPVNVLREEMSRLDISRSIAIGLTGSNAALITGGLNTRPVDFVQAEILAVRRRFPDARNIVNVGGASVTLIQLDEKGGFLDYATNSLCAAGTGAFLDQQADRLGIRYEDASLFGCVSDPPAIATRCSVFAKTDLIHRQQEGYGKAELWCGLCRSMTGTFLQALLRGRPLRGLTVITGGVSQNAEVLRWLRARYGDMVRTYEGATYSGAEGAAHLTNGNVDDLQGTLGSLRDTGRPADAAARRPPLVFRRTRYPDFSAVEFREDGLGNEVRVTRWPEGAELSVYLGIDVGSTSTKAMLVDEAGEPLADVYRRTAGDPIRATQLLLRAIEGLAGERNARLAVRGVGTTGSGRKLVGKVVGADAIINEITAHLAGAMRVDASIDTIFEIGGQDSKYIHARGGRIYDSNMNYVCAAGTGSFVEEQARKLGLALNAIGEAVMGIAPPITSDRCTVFMEQEVDRLIRRGYTREECMAAVLCSVVKNYLTKVVGRRPVSRDKVFFQGATARNKGLVAAFENILGVEVVVSPYCHVMGAYGVALLVRRRMAGRGLSSGFKGLDLSRRRVALRTETCSLCSNHCRITFAEIEDEAERPSWGYMCGRDPSETRARVNAHFDPFRRRIGMLFAGPDAEAKGVPRAVVGIPRSLVTYSHLPLWRRFFSELGVKAKVSARTSEETVQRGTEWTAADFCFPVKVAHGAVDELARDPAVDWIFVPHVIQADPNPKAINSHFCPYVQAFPAVVRSALRLRGLEDRIVSPVVDLQDRDGAVAGNLHAALGERLGVSRAQVRRAWRLGRRDLAAFGHSCREEGARILREIERTGEKAIVIMGRPYNTLDLGANLALPQKIAELGVRVIPMDMLPYDLHDLNPGFSGMYWQSGQHILCAAEFVRGHPNLFPVYLTNFSCGPDSFLLTYVEEMMGEKPFLIIEMDEHGGDAGYMTRIEAFLDVVESWRPTAQAPFVLAAPPSSASDIRRFKLWIPPMHPFTSRLFAAAFRREGFDSEALPPEDVEAFDLGRSLTRGSECLPAALTTGTFIRQVRSMPGVRHALFMPCAEGPCRFGQYATLQRLVLNRLGRADVPILSPSSLDTYQGLSRRLRVGLWKAVLAGDILFKCGCRLRPYEQRPGETDAALEQAVRRCEEATEAGADLRCVLAESLGALARAPSRHRGGKPLVGIVGEIYVRSDPFANDHVARAVEQAGGEAWITPAGEWVLYAAALEEIAAGRGLDPLRWLLVKLKNHFLFRLEHAFHEIAGPLLAERREPPVWTILKEGRSMLPVEFGGESILTIGRARLFARDGARLIVNVAPFGCMPGTITSALCREVQQQTGVPVVSMFYDGEQGQNQRLGVFLNNLAASRS